MLLETKSVKSNLHNQNIKKVPPLSGIFYSPPWFMERETMVVKFISQPNTRAPSCFAHEIHFRSKTGWATTRPKRHKEKQPRKAASLPFAELFGDELRFNF